MLLHQGVSLQATLGILIGCFVGGLSLLISFIFIVREYRRRAMVHCISSELSTINVDTVGCKREIRKYKDIEYNNGRQDLD